MKRDQSVSVIITTRNEEKIVERLINSVKKQTYKKCETILVDNNSEDKTADTAKSLGVKVYNFGPERSAQRNFGARKANGEYLLFLDADMELTKKVVSECAELAEADGKIGGIIIPETPVAERFWEKVKAFERSFYNKKGDSLTDAARFFPKKIFEKVGGYDETITGPEDWDITDRLRERGFQIGRIKAMIYHYERIPSLLSLLRKKFYYALDSYKYFKKNNVSIAGPKTIYFLRPVFYQDINKIMAHPILSLGMFVMLSLELLGGGMGFLIGRFRR